MEKFEGILAATVTPMLPSGQIDSAAIQPMVERFISHGIAGLVPCGGTGEYATLSLEERRTITKQVIEAARGRIPIVPHTGALSTADTIDLSVEAERAGASAVMVAPPFHDVLTKRELVAHYRAVAQSIRIPVVLYNHPDVTKVNFTPELASELAEIDGVRFMKDSSGNAAAVAQLLGHHADRITLLTGADSMAFYAFVLGAKGAIWGAANVVPGPCVELHRLIAVEGDLAGGLALWRRLWPVMDALERTPYVAAVKFGTELMGGLAGPPRLPLMPLVEDDRALVESALAPFAQTVAASA